MNMTQSLANKQPAFYTLLVQASQFLRQFLKNPIEVGSLIPSSRYLAAAMLAGLKSEKLKSVVEYGPGNGAFTSILSANLSPDAQLFAVEPNKYFADQIQMNLPSATVIRDYADRTSGYIGSKNGEVDLVVSGLPFSLMAWESIESTILETHAILKPGGTFRTFVYCHMNQYWKIRHMRELIESLFIETSYKMVIRNFPPAFVITCVK
jgi:phosphatidylethanolamine/phosphatidyl-N-methylethanolamine N-methyltransferase